MALQNIENIIFDLGGVIIDIDPQRAFKALAALYQGKQSSEQLLSENVQLFLDYEKGFISDTEFREGIRKLTDNPSIKDEEIDAAWNSMLLHIPVERLQTLEKLKSQYKIFVLSNTNAIHVSAFNKIIEQNSGKADINHFFDKVYYSHELKLRKPEPEIYQHVIDDHNLNVGSTLFVDDRLENIEAAAAVGLQTFHVQLDQGIVDFFAVQ
ncbi:HAD family hydrolase [Catalinimonas niigatensis]|uniref:HAD family hydrolase n=1 Tax=Catalinimonas niigatensis TaxID=1397264 RepID=UPI0026670DA9|nr:HAD family phosphatase [Catalinimonas niigatensis]WPP51276.1 HAD family phosphatase [Catalinimonas niigatensis]